MCGLLFWFFSLQDWSNSSMCRFLVLVFIAGLFVACGDAPAEALVREVVATPIPAPAPTVSSAPRPTPSPTQRPAPTASPTVSLTEARAVADEAMGEARQDLLEKLSPAELERFEAILFNTVGQPGYVTDDIRQELWQLLDKIGYRESQLDELRELTTSDAIKYQRLFWRDVLMSLETGRAEMSPERLEMEAAFLASGVINQARFDATAVLLRDVAVGRPIQLPGQDTSVVVDEEFAKNILASIDYVAGEIDRLLTRPD